MSEVIRSSMTSIPDENWERAFGKKEVVGIVDGQVNHDLTCLAKELHAILTSGQIPDDNYTQEC